MFDKIPKLVKKVDDKSTFFIYNSGSYDQLRKAALSKKQVNSSIKK